MAVGTCCITYRCWQTWCSNDHWHSSKGRTKRRWMWCAGGPWRRRHDAGTAPGMPLTVAASTVSSNEIGEREVVHVLGTQMCRALRRGVVAGSPRALARAPARATVDVNRQSGSGSDNPGPLTVPQRSIERIGGGPVLSAPAVACGGAGAAGSEWLPPGVGHGWRLRGGAADKNHMQWAYWTLMDRCVGCFVSATADT